MTEDKRKETGGGKVQPEGGKSIAGGDRARDAKDERLPGADERQGGKPFDKVRGGRS
jgi:hypothetical protein